MIRVLQVVNAADRGGAETMVMNLYRNVNREEIQFDFTNHKGEKGAFDNEIESLGGKIIHLPKFKGYNYFKYIKSWKELLKTHTEYKIIHIHNYNIAGIVSRVAHSMGIPVVITHSHSTRLNMSWIKRRGFAIFRKSIINNSTHRFACGENAGRFLFGERDFTIFPNAISSNKFKFNDLCRHQLRSKLGIDPSVRVYGHVGTFRTPKNHTFLIKIFAELVKIEPTSKLILIGSGELMGSIKSKVTEKGISESVIFLGQQPNVNEWLSAFDVYLMPSLWEGFPVSVVEAQCSGLPCVVSNVIDSSVDLTGEVTFLSLESNAEQWAVTLHKLPSSNRVDMGNKISKSDFEITKAVKWISDFYKKVTLYN